MVSRLFALNGFLSTFGDAFESGMCFQTGAGVVNRLSQVQTSKTSIEGKFICRYYPAYRVVIIYRPETSHRR